MNHHKTVLFSAIGLIFALVCGSYGASEEADIWGALKKWHKITITFAGPEASEDAELNPFLDYRLNVTFTKGSKQYVVPGYYAADGDAAETSARTGNKWRVHFVPDEEGRWSYKASFRRGKDISLNNDPKAGKATAFDGVKGTFIIDTTDKRGRDFRGKGFLKYVGNR